MINHRRHGNLPARAATSLHRRLALLVAMVLTIAACGGGELDVTIDPIGGAADPAGTRYVGTGTVTLSKATVANECSSVVDVELVVTDYGKANLTLEYRDPISDQIVKGEESLFICTDEGIPRTREYGTDVEGDRLVFTPDSLLGGFVDGEIVVVISGAGASLSGQTTGGGNVRDWVAELASDG